MASYQMYKDRTVSINSEYGFNGLFRQYDGGLSFGADMKLRQPNACTQYQSRRGNRKYVL